MDCTRTQTLGADKGKPSADNNTKPQEQPTPSPTRLQILNDCYTPNQGQVQELPQCTLPLHLPPQLPSLPPPTLYSTHDDTLYVKLLQFYKMSDDGTQNPNLDIMVEHKSRVSLRLLDWCVTNYAKQRYITYDITSATGAVTRFNMHNSYHLKLDSYSKERFDPFRRGMLIQFPYKNNLCIETTIAQLSFYKWAIEHLVLEYIDANYDAIERDMNARNSNSRRARPKQASGAPKTRKRREELSVSASKFIKKEHVRTEITFS